jgi:hypothetical protein
MEDPGWPVASGEAHSLWKVRPAGRTNSRLKGGNSIAQGNALGQPVQELRVP